MNFSDIITQCGLECTEAEFREAYEAIDGKAIEARVRKNMKVSKHSFDEEYNGRTVENEAGGEFYYVIATEGMAFLQPFVPGAVGFQPITSENVDNVIEAHVEEIIKMAVVNEKLRATFEFFEK